MLSQIDIYIQYNSSIKKVVIGTVAHSIGKYVIQVLNVFKDIPL